MAGNTHSERKTLQALQSFLCFSPIHDTFFSCACFLCQICREKLCACVSVGAFCKADIYAKSKGEQLSTFSEKMCINDLTFGQFFGTDKA